MPYNSYKTLDGDILFGGGNDRLFGVLADKLGYSDWKTDPRFVTNNVRVKNRAELDRMIEEKTKHKTTQEWLEIFEGSGMPYAAVNDIQGTLNHKHGEYSQILQLVWFTDKILQYYLAEWCRKLIIPHVVLSNLSIHRSNTRTLPQA